MNTKSKLGMAALAAVLGLGLAAGAAGPGLAQMMGPDGQGHHGRHAGFHGPRADRIDGRVAFLKAELKITPAQESKWKDFEKVLREQAAERRLAGEKMRAEMQARRAEFQKAAEEAKAKGQPIPQPARPHLTAVERMERQQKFMKARLESQEKLLDAFKPLYAALSPEQQKTADELFGHGPGGGHGNGHGPRGR
jgi:hypothetical protein